MTTPRAFDPPASFTGWLREAGSPWHPVCQAPTWAGCWRALLRVETSAPACERLVAAAGRHPDDRSRPR